MGFSPGFSLLPTLGYYSALGFLFFPPLAKFLSFSSLVYNISHPWFFTFFNPWLLFSPQFSIFFFYPPLVIILPLVFSSSQPWLFFSPRFSLFPILGYYSALGLYSAGESTLINSQEKIKT